MQRPGVTLAQFHHVCCAVANLVDTRRSTEVTAIGSAALLPWIDGVLDVWLSKDVDVVVEDPTVQAAVDCVGEGSLFQEAHGVYAEGVPPELFVAPRDWAARARSYENPHYPNSARHRVRVPAPLDLVTAKLVRGDEADRDFARYCVDHGLVSWAGVEGNLTRAHAEQRAASSEFLPGLDRASPVLRPTGGALK